MSNRIVLESSADILDSLRAKIAQERYWLAGTIVGVIVGSLLPWEQVRVFSVFAGGAFFVLVFAELCYSIRHEHNWHEARLLVYRKQNGLVPVAPVIPVKVFATTITPSGSKTTIKEYAPEQIPPVDFIEWLFVRANGSGRVPSERAIFEEWTAAANPWLATLEEQRIVEKAGTNDNAPRRIVDGVTVAMARERFGYPALSETDSSQSAPD